MGKSIKIEMSLDHLQHITDNERNKKRTLYVESPPDKDMIYPLNPLSVLMLIILCVCVGCVALSSYGINHDHRWNNFLRGESAEQDRHEVCPNFDYHSENFNLTPAVHSNLIREGDMDKLYLSLNVLYVITTLIYLLWYCCQNRAREKMGVFKFYFIFSIILHLICVFAILIVVKVSYTENYEVAIQEILQYEKNFYEIITDPEVDPNFTGNTLMTFSASPSFLRERIVLKEGTGVPVKRVLQIHSQCRSLRQMLEVCMEIIPLIYYHFPHDETKISYVIVKDEMCDAKELMEIGFCQHSTSKLLALLLTLIIIALCLLILLLSVCISFSSVADTGIRPRKSRVNFAKDPERENELRQLPKIRKTLLKLTGATADDDGVPAKVAPPRPHQHHHREEAADHGPADAYRSYEAPYYQDDVYDEAQPPIYPKMKKSGVNVPKDNRQNDKDRHRDHKMHRKTLEDDDESDHEEFLQIAFTKYPC